jgi:hypothetical protein
MRCGIADPAACKDVVPQTFDVQLESSNEYDCTAVFVPNTPDLLTSEITGLSPDFGGAGTAFTIEGMNLGTTEEIVFGDFSIAYILAHPNGPPTDTTVSGQVPDEAAVTALCEAQLASALGTAPIYSPLLDAGAPCKLKVSVITTTGSATAADLFTVVMPTTGDDAGVDASQPPIDGSSPPLDAGGDAGVCTPATNCPVGPNCGSFPDGCGGFINCGTCTPPQTCGGGGLPNFCGTPTLVPPTLTFNAFDTGTATFSSSYAGCLVYTNGRYIACGSQATATSTDGMAWTITTWTGTPLMFHQIVWFGGQYVAVEQGGGAAVYTSPDLTTWTMVPATPPPPATGSVTLIGLGTNGTVLYGSGQDNVTGSPEFAFYVSTDGKTWTTTTVLPSSGFPESNGDRFIYPNGHLVWLGNMGMYTSLDGKAWTAVPQGASGVAWSGTQYVGVGGSDVSTSPDLMTWQSQLEGLGGMQDVAAVPWMQGSMLIGTASPVGTQGGFHASLDAKDWYRNGAMVADPPGYINADGPMIVALGSTHIYSAAKP